MGDDDFEPYLGLFAGQCRLSEQFYIDCCLEEFKRRCVAKVHSFEEISQFVEDAMVSRHNYRLRVEGKVNGSITD